jgi:hypothetical protein
MHERGIDSKEVENLIHNEATVVIKKSETHLSHLTTNHCPNDNNIWTVLLRP